MKKLLVTVVGAVTALGAFAALQSDTVLQFENLSDGVITTNGLNTALGDYFSHGEGASNNTYTVSGATISCPVPSQITGNTTKALDIKTTFGNPLDVSVVAGGTAQDIGTGIYFDSLVKFTVCEDAPTQTYDGAKIVMWLQSEDGTGPTNLMVRAGYLSYSAGSGVTSEATTYTCQDVGGDFADGFHRVTIKAIANITTDANVSVPGFAIYIDGSNADYDRLANSSASKFDATFEAQFELTEAAGDGLNNLNALFPSLVQSGSATQLTKAGFDGTGSVTDIVFTDDAPAFAADYVAPQAAVEINGVADPTIKTLAGAVAAANNAASEVPVVITLQKGMTLEDAIEFDSEASITLDFAGFVLTNDLGVAAITNNAFLTVTNSVGNGGVTGISEGSSAFFNASGAQLDIYGGTFRADVEFSEANVFIAGGSFQQDADAFTVPGETEEEIISLIADGKKMVANTDTGLNDVVDIVTYTITFVYGELSVSQTIEAGEMPEVPTSAAAAAAPAGWVFTGWDKEIVAAGADVTYTAQYTQYVAQIENGDSYTSLQAAVDAAQAGDTIDVLADCTISTSLSIAKDLTIRNNYTITGAVNYAICIGAKVSFEGSGKIERASNISGSAFCVGANEATRGTITVGTAGTLNFTGLTVCGGSGGNLIKLENGTVNMNGGVLKDGLRGIKADADKGSYTSAIVINDGTITNCTGCAVMASAESANGTATVTINGGVICGVLDAKTGASGQNGTHTITIPATSTAKFDRDQTAFCASGYETALSDGWYVVGLATYTITYKTADGAAFTAWAENYTAPASFTIEADATLPVAANIALTGVQFNGWTNATGTAVLTTAGLTANLEVFANTTALVPVAIDPSASVVEVTVAAESETAAIEAVTVTPPANSGADAAEYKALFNFTATAGDAGKYTVTLTGIKEEVTTTVSTDAVKLLDGTGDGKVAVPAGLYYKVTPSTALPISGDAQTGVSDGTGVGVTKPGTTQGFIEVKLSPTPFAN